jgi:ABC-type dipeptide/oligopeptide/nickel transport system permease subunit
MSALSRWRGSRSPQADLVRRFASDRSALLGLAIIAIIAIVGVAAPWLSPFDPNAQALQLRRAEPSREHVLGMDELGRDILSRLMYGAGNTLVAGTIAVLVGAAVGVPLGLIAGYYGRYVEAVIMRAIDAMLAFPAFLLAIVIVAVLGPSLENATLAIGIAQIPAFTRLVRGSVLSVREREFVMGAVAVGARGRDIMARHILPNVMPSIIVLSTVSLANAVLSIAGLSFLGLGAQPPAAEWGVMLRSGREYIRDAPHLTVVPGVAIVALVLSFNLIGDGLRDALDPRLARR